MPVINPNTLPQNQGSWFPEFLWGSPDQQPAMPQFTPPQGSGTETPWGGGTRLPPPDIPQMPPVPQPSGTSTAWGGQQMPNAAASAPVDPGMDVAPESPSKGKFSFMDNPGASDALVAFGAAMLKAPDFNSGLGDAALAVNQVAKQYRMPTEQDYARAKMLGMTARLARGYSMTDPNQAGGGVEVDQKTAFYDPNGKLYFAATGANGEPGVWDSDAKQFVAGGVPGLVRATDSAVGSINKYGTKFDAEAEQQLYTEAMAANDNVMQLDQLAAIAPTAGVGLDAKTRLMRGIAQLTGGNVGEIDPTSISTLQASTKQLGLNWSQKMKGQGQVTESERQLISDMLPQAVSDPQAFQNLVSFLKKVEMRKQQMANEWFTNQAALRQQYGSFRGFMLSRVKELEISAPMTGNGPDSAPAANPELEDALKQYGD